MGKIFDYDGVPVLHTTSGDLKGYFYDGVYIYKGIPYAYADRFQMPVPSKWDVLTPVGDDRKFADEIIGLLKNPEKAKRLGKQASELREQLNVKKIAKEWEKLLED